MLSRIRIVAISFALTALSTQTTEAGWGHFHRRHARPVVWVPPTYVYYPVTYQVRTAKVPAVYYRPIYRPVVATRIPVYSNRPVHIVYLPTYR